MDCDALIAQRQHRTGDHTFSSLAAPGFAEQVTWRDYSIYYTTFRSTLVPPEVADQHGITRGERRILTNITVRQQGEPVRAGCQRDRHQSAEPMTTLEFTEVIEEAAIYYLANQLVDERDTLRYRLRVQTGRRGCCARPGVHAPILR
ncbi:MAG: DUF4426 domain-containing protein [Gammaproteobacteria bacterium]|nr:DUF4426 domain-containing protein [Gammaproteobacteria bacterium]